MPNLESSALQLGSCPSSGVRPSGARKVRPQKARNLDAGRESSTFGLLRRCQDQQGMFEGGGLPRCARRRQARHGTRAAGPARLCTPPLRARHGTRMVLAARAVGSPRGGAATEGRTGHFRQVE